MKLAIIAVTANGVLLAEKLAANLPYPAELFAKSGRNPSQTAIEYESLGILIEQLFYKYEGLIFIMAAGIVVRVIAPHVRDKRFDPAVVVLDEAGEYAISLLSGHIGGANNLAHLVGKAIQAKPVVTTATDVNHKPAADVLAVKLDLAIEPYEKLKAINAAIVNGDKVAFYIDKTLINYAHFATVAAEMGIELLDCAALSRADSYDAAVVISDKELYMVKPHLYLRPATLAAGIGCRKGGTSAEIYAAVMEACKLVGRSPKSLAVIGTTTAKQEEIGLLAAAQQLEVPLEFFTNEQLQTIIQQCNLTVSEFVENQIGVGNVCEAAALKGGQTEKLILPRTVYNNITIALAEVQYRWWE
ncbi:MAG: cobalt-precorrin 5A hydrolase [Negativicutes bacterium]|nr:cobalt-precorrin 5A hydrolase [Negativicutes bacterium]